LVLQQKREKKKDKERNKGRKMKGQKKSMYSQEVKEGVFEVS